MKRCIRAAATIVAASFELRQSLVGLGLGHAPVLVRVYHLEQRVGALLRLLAGLILHPATAPVVVLRQRRVAIAAPSATVTRNSSFRSIPYGSVSRA